MVHFNTFSSINSYGRQPLRPGQWSRMSMTKQTTYVQNNFYGNGYGDYYSQGYNYDTTSNSGSNKLLNWLLGIGTGATLLGGLFSLFKKDGAGEVDQDPDKQKAKAKNEAEAKAKAEQDAKAKAEQEAKAKAEQEAKAKAEQEAKAKAEAEAKAKAEQDALRETQLANENIEGAGSENETGSANQGLDIKNGKSLTIKDLTAGTKPISGTVQNVNGDTFELVDKTKNPNGNVYKVQISQDANGNTKYTIISKNDGKVSKENEYTYNSNSGNLEQSGKVGIKTDAEWAGFQKKSTTSKSTLAKEPVHPTLPPPVDSSLEGIPSGNNPFNNRNPFGI